MSETIYDSKYLNDSSLRDYNIFAEEYFSGSDIKLTANNTVVKQISAIQYDLQEQLKPIYGYGSYIYDDIAVGSRIITGTFICPMKNLADNEEFKCGTSKSGSYTKNSYNQIRGNNYEVATKSKSLNLKNEPIYLNKELSIVIDTVTDEGAIVKYEDDKSTFVYSPKFNLNGYIKVGD